MVRLKSLFNIITNDVESNNIYYNLRDIQYV